LPPLRGTLDQPQASGAAHRGLKAETQNSEKGLVNTSPLFLCPYKKVPSFIAIFVSIKNSIAILNATVTAEDPAPSGRCLLWLNCHGFLLCPLGKQQWALFFGEESTILWLQYKGGGVPIPLKGHLLTQVAFIF
jgi:hypothetical protein